MELILFENAKRAVAQLQEFDEVREHLDKAAAVQEYARRANDRDMEIRAAEYRTYCERRAGEMLQGTPSHRPKKGTHDGTLTAREAGIEKPQATRYRQLAEVPQESFDDAVQDLKAQGRPPTRKRVMDVHFSSDSPEHYTPDIILELAMRTLGDITLDPCSDAGKNVPAKFHLTKEDDGLSCEWHGSVFMNPPYGKEIPKWVEKLAKEYHTGNVVSAIALVPARTDTAWFDVLAEFPVCFVRGRLKFKGNKDAAPFPSAVFFLGKAVRRFSANFGKIGTVWGRIS